MIPGTFIAGDGVLFFFGRGRVVDLACRVDLHTLPWLTLLVGVGTLSC